MKLVWYVLALAAAVAMTGDVLSVKATETGFECRIYNTHFREYMYAADHQPYDQDRRRVFTWRPGTHDNVCVWKLIPVTSGPNTERKFYIFSVDQNEYLYASNVAPFDADRRSVFTWRRRDDPDATMVWRIETTEEPNVYALYNVNKMEYLYASADTYDKDRRRVFTWQPGTRAGQQGIFRFEWLGQNPLH